MWDKEGSGFFCVKGLRERDKIYTFGLWDHNCEEYREG